jgi:hypothetical protein
MEVRMIQKNPKKLLVGFVVLSILCLGSAITAQADSITVVGFNDPNLQATINITSLTNGSITFSVTNVLVAGVTSSITGIGFALPGTITANSPGTCGPTLALCNNFTLTPTVTNSPGTVPNFPSATLDFAVVTGAAFAGGNPPGITQGTTATFTITGAFTGLTQQQFLSGVYVRFQSVSDPAFPNVTSDVAHDPGGPPTGVPEPASLVLLGTGLCVLTAWKRLRTNR